MHNFLPCFLFFSCYLRVGGSNHLLVSVNLKNPLLFLPLALPNPAITCRKSSVVKVKLKDLVLRHEKLRCVRREGDDKSHVYVFSEGSHFTRKEGLCYGDHHLCLIHFPSHQLLLVSYLMSYKSLFQQNSWCSSHQKCCS